VTPGEKGDLAERMVPRALELACLVHGDGDARAIRRFLRKLTLEEAGALLVVQAGMIPLDATRDQMLAWITFDEFGRPLEGMTPVLPIFAGDEGKADTEAAPWLEPCPSLAAYRRHKAAGEPAEECGCAGAARAEWRKQNRRRSEAGKPAAREDGVAA
jgi:hypothetical protein